MARNYVKVEIAREDYAPFAAYAVRVVLMDDEEKCVVDIREAATIAEAMSSLAETNDIHLVKLPSGDFDDGDCLSLSEVAEAVYGDFNRMALRREPHPYYTSADHYTGLGV